MTTITDILAEAFNRVKNEHGVTLSHADFEHYSGNLSGVTFTSSGIVRMVYPATGAMPPQMAAAPIPWPQLPQPPIVHQVDPTDATHIGSVDVYDDCYWKFDGAVLYLWDGAGSWGLYDMGVSALRTVESQLRSVNSGKNDDLVEMTPEMLATLLKPVPGSAPEGTTHYGILAGGNPRYYRYVNDELLRWSSWHGWRIYESLIDATDAELVEQLTPVNPA